MDNIGNLFKIIERYDHYINIANNKANYLLAFIVSLSVAVAALIGYSETLRFSFETPITNILKTLAILTYVVNLFFSIQIIHGIHKIIFPNTSSPITATKSNIFFGDVASRSHVEYSNSIKRVTPEELQEDLSYQANALAKIVGEKFRHQKRVMDITAKQYIASTIIICFLCGIIKAIS